MQPGVGKLLAGEKLFRGDGHLAGPGVKGPRLKRDPERRKRHLNHPPHPLIDRILWLGDDDPELCTIMLAARLDPRTGQKLAASHIVSLGLLPMHGEAEIFQDWESLKRAVDGPEDGNRVVRQLGPELVKRTDSRNGQLTD
jgi:hypothetical protein